MRSPPELLSVVLLVLAACGAGEAGAPGTSESTEPASPARTADAGDEGTAWKTLSERACPPSSPLTYDNFGAPFFLTWCTGCHGGALSGDARRGAPAAVTFDEIEPIRSRAAQIWSRAADANETMPPSGGPTAAERTQLGEWLACGAR
jgi:hypothetical protein